MDAINMGGRSVFSLEAGIFQRSSDSLPLAFATLGPEIVSASVSAIPECTLSPSPLPIPIRNATTTTINPPIRFDHQNARTKILDRFDALFKCSKNNVGQRSRSFA